MGLSQNSEVGLKLRAVAGRGGVLRASCYSAQNVAVSCALWQKSEGRNQKAENGRRKRGSLCLHVPVLVPCVFGDAETAADGEDCGSGVQKVLDEFFVVEEDLEFRGAAVRTA